MTTETNYRIELDTNSDDETGYLDAYAEIETVLDRTAPAGSYWHVAVEGRGWQRQSGWIVVEHDDVLPLLTDAGNEYRVVFEVSDALPIEFHAVRFSHDEPTGASFTIRPATDEEIELTQS